MMTGKMTLRIFVSTICLALAFGGCVQENERKNVRSEAQQEEVLPEGAKVHETAKGERVEIRLQISGLKSEEDAVKIRSGLIALDGISAVQVVFRGQKEGGIAFISYDPGKSSADEIKKAIAKLGFKAKEAQVK